MCPKLAPDLYPLQGQVAFSSFSAFWGQQGSWIGSGLQAPGIMGKMSSQCTLSHALISWRPLMSIVVLEIWGNMTCGINVITLYGLLWAVMRLSVIAAQVLEGGPLSSFFIPHNFGLWIPGAVACQPGNSQNVSESAFNLFTAQCAARWWWQVNGLCLNEINVCLPGLEVYASVICQPYLSGYKKKLYLYADILLGPFAKKTDVMASSHWSVLWVISIPPRPILGD